MYAGHFYEPTKVKLVDVPEQTLNDSTVDREGGGLMVFQPELACLCGSDLTYYEGNYPEFSPQVGQSLHEMIGRVVETDGDRFKPGDRVLVVPVEHFGFFERYVVSDARAIPVDERPLPEHALMAQPLGTVICALKKLPNIIDKTVVVMGQGPMGQLWNVALSNLGARDVIGVDLLASRLETSPKMGATATIDASQHNPVEVVREMTNGQMADLVVEVVGHREQVLNTCIKLGRPHSTILFFGVPTDKIDDINWKEMFWKNMSIVNSVGPSFETDFPLAMKWIAEKRVDVSPIVSCRYPVQEVQTAFDVFFHRRDGAIKVLLDM